MKKFFIYILAFCPSVLMFGQSALFKSIGGGAGNVVNNFAYDSVTQKLYINGQFTKVGQNFNAKWRAIWKGNQWDSIHHILDDSTWTFQRVKANDIYSFYFKLLKLNPISGNWDKITTVSKNGFISSLTTFQNDLIIIGPYDSINGQPIKRIARYNGITFTPFDNTPFVGSISSAVEFQGKLYIAGNFAITNSCGTIYRFAVWDGSCWKQVGNGIQGGFSGVWKLIVYKNKLYVGGSFLKANGNPGNCLFSFDGTNYDDLGGGFMGTNDKVLDMFIYKNKLIITGVGWSNIPTTSTQCPNFFSFDGNDFCTYFNYQNVSSEFGQIGVYNDTLIFVTPQIVGNDTVNFISKYMGNMNPQLCVNAVGLNEIGILNTNIRLYPNPTSSTLYISAEQYFEKETEIEITNSLGQIVLKLPFQNEIDVSNLSSGYYVLRIINSDKKQFHSKFIKE